MGASKSDQILKEAQGLQSSGRLRRAGMSRGQTKWADTKYRGDETMWLTEILEELPAVKDLVGMMQKIRDEIAIYDKQGPNSLRVDDGRKSVQLAYYISFSNAFLSHVVVFVLFSPSIFLLDHR